MKNLSLLKALSHKKKGIAALLHASVIAVHILVLTEYYVTGNYILLYLGKKHSQIVNMIIIINWHAASRSFPVVSVSVIIC